MQTSNIVRRCFRSNARTCKHLQNKIEKNAAFRQQHVHSVISKTTATFGRDFAQVPAISTHPLVMQSNAARGQIWNNLILLELAKLRTSLDAGIPMLHTR